MTIKKNLKKEEAEHPIEIPKGVNLGSSDLSTTYKDNLFEEDINYPDAALDYPTDESGK